MFYFLGAQSILVRSLMFIEHQLRARYCYRHLLYISKQNRFLFSSKGHSFRNFGVELLLSSSVYCGRTSVLGDCVIQKPVLKYCASVTKLDKMMYAMDDGHICPWVNDHQGLKVFKRNKLIFLTNLCGSVFPDTFSLTVVSQL